MRYGLQTDWVIFDPADFFMKTMFITAFVLFVTGIADAQSEVVQKSTTVQQNAPDVLLLKETIHDFGQIPQGKPVYYFFEIVNNGPVPLKLENVQASCGCTTPEWNKDPIPVNGADKIKVGYNAASEGPFKKFITITYNGNQTKQITIEGAVWKAPAGSAPANTSVQFLKQQMQ